jgi:serine/threonine protein kinase
MGGGSAFDEALVHRLPLPLARLYRHAHNAKTPLDRHQAAYYLWEAALKLLGSAAVATVAEVGEPAPDLAERLRNLARPSLGHWWEFVRLLLPTLADAGDPGFRAARDLILGRPRDDLPRAAGLDAALREALDGAGGARVTVRLDELFERLVRYRNREIGHGAAGLRPPEHYDRMGRALLAGTAELLGRLEVLAGRSLVHVSDVRRKPSGAWLAERYELIGEARRRLDPLELPEDDAGRLPGLVYLEGGAAPTSLHPLLVYDFDADRVLALNARRGRLRTEYLDYLSGETSHRPDLVDARRDMLRRSLGMTNEPDSAQVEGWAAASWAKEGPTPESSTPPLRRIGDFELVSRLGQGGMGVVYRAWQPSVGRQVALKCLLRAGEARAEARFAREIRALGRVEHPHLVKIYTSGADGDQWFYVMELVEGATLADVGKTLSDRASSSIRIDLSTWRDALSTACEEARKAEKLIGDGPPADPPPARPPSAALVAGRGYVHHVAELVRQVALAAHALHECGVIHRDIKPGNIMVTPDGAHAVLMDLGLAQLADEHDGKLTRTRQFVGTLRFASPEQVRAIKKLDRRSDVYSLGATLWELLALQPLFDATDETPTPDLMERIQLADPGRIRPRNPEVPADMEAIALKCLEKDPGRRYATAQELAEDLGRWLRGDPVRAHRRTPGYIIARGIRRHRAQIAIGSALLLLQAGMLLAVYLLASAARSRESVIPAPSGAPTIAEATVRVEHPPDEDRKAPGGPRRDAGPTPSSPKGESSARLDEESDRTAARTMDWLQQVAPGLSPKINALAAEIATRVKSFPESNNSVWIDTIRSFSTKTGFLSALVVAMKKDLEAHHLHVRKDARLGVRGQVGIDSSGQATGHPTLSWEFQLVDSRSGQILWESHGATPLDMGRPVPSGTSPAEARAERIAICIGIEKYQDPAIPELHSCVRDAERMAVALRALCGVDRVRLLLEDRATRQAIRDAIVSDSRPGDTVFIFFSGHMGQCADLDGDEADGMDEYLVPYDGTLKGPRGMILDDDFARWMEQLVGRRIGVILDSVYSGGFLDRGRIRDRVALLAACREDQIAYERPDRLASVLTHFLLEVIDSPSADSDGDGQLTLREAYQAVREPVRQYVYETFQTAQDPSLIDDLKPDLLLRTKAAQAMKPTEPILK